MNKDSKFWDRIADRYAKSPVADEAAYQTKLHKTQSYLTPEMEVLEFGCGTGSTALVHAPFVKHILATDISAKMLDIARRKAEAAHIENVTFHHAAIDDLTASDESFDMVLGLSILHLVQNKDTVISKVHAMLKPGGVFISSTPCLGDYMKFFRFIAPAGKALGLMPVIKIFTVADLREALKHAGFVIDHEWQPGKGKAVFMVAKKPARA